MNSVASFMLLFNFTLTTPSGDLRDEIVNVYSKHFESQQECTDFLDSWESIIKSRGVDTLQEMLKEGYKVNLKHVTCSNTMGDAHLDEPGGVNEPSDNESHGNDVGLTNDGDETG